MVQKTREELETIETPQEKYAFLEKSESRLIMAVRSYVWPYERLRLQIWTRLQQLDFVEYHEAAKIPADLVKLPHALTLEQMVEQWLSNG